MAARPRVPRLERRAGAPAGGARLARVAPARRRARAAPAAAFAAPASPPRPWRGASAFVADPLAEPLAGGERAPPGGRAGGAGPPAPPPPGALRPLPKRVEGVADDPSLANPLARAERLGTGWLGAVLELEGVCVEYEYGDVGARAWLAVAAAEGRPSPPRWQLRRAEGCKAEQAVSEVFCWSRAPGEVRRLAGAREAALAALLADRRPLAPPGARALLDTLDAAGAPAALVSSAPEARTLATLEAAGLAGRFAAVVTAGDVYRGRPDPEGYLVAAAAIGRPPARCVVVGASNASVEAAAEGGMRCVAVAGRHPAYELAAADLVVRSLGELSFVNLKQLFANEEGVLPASLAAEPAAPEDAAPPSPWGAVAVHDGDGDDDGDAW